MNKAENTYKQSPVERVGGRQLAISSVLFLLLLSFTIQTSFRTEQKQNARVKIAYSEKYESLKKELSAAGIEEGQLNILFRVLKKEKRFEVWAKKKSETTYSLFKKYEICSSSGDLGPKRKAGDGQVPEGFYHIDRFNPYSNFYLSLGVNYPNSSDRILGYKKNLGGDIFIHGSCVTVGCMPLTDEFIKEVYVLAVEARASGQAKLPCLIFPAEMDAEGMKWLLEAYAGDQEKITFWKDLSKGYSLFEKNKKVPTFTVSVNGSYQFNSN